MLLIITIMLLVILIIMIMLVVLVLPSNARVRVFRSTSLTQNCSLQPRQ